MMASTKNYLDFILGQLSGIEEISHRAMMGEWAGRERPLYGKPDPEETDSPDGAE